MSLPIAIDTSQLDALARAWSQAPEVARREVTATVYDAELLLEREVRERTPIGASGGAGLRESITAELPEVLGDRIIGTVGTALAYAEPVELGTKPHRPPVEPLVDWVEKKFGLRGKEARQAAWGIAGKIARRGTAGAHMFAGAYEQNRRQVVEMFVRMNARIAEWLARHPSGPGGR